LASPRHILVFRFSALGDVAMTVPVIRNLVNQYPDLHIYFVGQTHMQPLFDGMERVQFYSIDIRKWKGLHKIYLLGRQIRKDIAFDAIADLHDSLRTKLLRFFLVRLFKRMPLAVIDKGRSEKEELTRQVNKKLRPLKTTFQRYADVFTKVGLPVQLNIDKGIAHPVKNKGLLPFENRGQKIIGVAPFARHAAKRYPLDKMKEVVRLLTQQEETAVLLFGSKGESDLTEQWEKEMKQVYSVAGRNSFADELNIISQLDVMISMDSANMHLATLYGVPVISIWGGTHPYLGFYGWGQLMDNAIQLDLPCRPSSVFGNKKCPVHGDKGCMEGITPEVVVNKVNSLL
jgi:ADP-heptose:LPS heptosyltransferase